MWCAHPHSGSRFKLIINRVVTTFRCRLSYGPEHYTYRRIDQKRHSVETSYALLTLIYYKQIFLLRGSHIADFYLIDPKPPPPDTYI
jgi:hypothetical protein